MCDEECAASEDHQTECRYLSKLSVASLDIKVAILPVVRLLVIRKHDRQAWSSNIGNMATLYHYQLL